MARNPAASVSSLLASSLSCTSSSLLVLFSLLMLSTCRARSSIQSASASNISERLDLRRGMASLGRLLSSIRSVVLAPAFTTFTRGSVRVNHLLSPRPSPSSKGTSEVLSVTGGLAGVLMSEPLSQGWSGPYWTGA